MIETWSPGAMPCATNPLATAATSAAKAAAVTGVQVPPRPDERSITVPCGLRATRLASNPGMLQAVSASTRLGDVISRIGAPGQRGSGTSTLVGDCAPRCRGVRRVDDPLEERAGPLLARRGDDLLGGPDLDDLPVVHEHHAVADLACERHLVGHHEHRHAGLGQVAHDGEDVTDELGVCLLYT